MDTDNYIIKHSGANWKHSFLNKIALQKEFPSRLRLFHLIKNFWGLELLKSTTPSGLKLLLDINDYVQSQIYFFGNYEPKSVELFKNLSLNANVIFDIGSHIGQYALECAQIDTTRTKKIFTIEVNPKTFTYLLNNIQINKFTNVNAVLGAISSAPGIVNINIPAYWNMGNTQIDDSNSEKGLDDYLAASFNLTTLLEKFNLTHIDLVKIDVEGHESDVLQSLFDKNIIPTNILFEYIPESFANAFIMLNLLKEKGYSIKDITGKEYKGHKDIPEQNLWAQKL